MGGGLGTPRSRGTWTINRYLEEFQGGKTAQYFSQSFQRRCIWTCLEVRKEWASQFPSSVLSFEPKPSDVTGSRSNGCQKCAAGHPGAASAAAHRPSGCRFDSIDRSKEMTTAKQGWSKVILGMQALKTGCNDGHLERKWF